ncbi:hypothetical protein [Saccharopolyspora griseoalba]|uniref:Uncharacterized protein n=1 Tax=Saccharopolyspora griseoalba TaxID=1431848 RepID=A0ABW2LSI7_9PSEU
MGWGDPAYLDDPANAAGAFYTALLQVDGWQQMQVTDAAQEVQRSAHPVAYADHEDQARAIARAFGIQT